MYNTLKSFELIALHHIKMAVDKRYRQRQRLDAPPSKRRKIDYDELFEDLEGMDCEN